MIIIIGDTPGEERYVTDAAALIAGGQNDGRLQIIRDGVPEDEYLPADTRVCVVPS